MFHHVCLWFLSLSQLRESPVFFLFFLKHCEHFCFTILMFLCHLPLRLSFQMIWIRCHNMYCQTCQQKAACKWTIHQKEPQSVCKTKPANVTMTYAVWFRHLSFSEDYLFVLRLCVLKVGDMLLFQMQVWIFVSASTWASVVPAKLSKQTTTFMLTTFVEDGCHFGISHGVLLSFIHWQWWEDTRCFWADLTEHGWDKSLCTSKGFSKSIGRCISEPGTAHTSTHVLLACSFLAVHYVRIWFGEIKNAFKNVSPRCPAKHVCSDLVIAESLLLPTCCVKFRGQLW